MASAKPSLHTCLSPALLHLYEVNNSIVVIIDILRATSTIAAALKNGAKCVIPVDSVTRCIELGKQIEGITAGERDGKVAEGLVYGNTQKSLLITKQWYLPQRTAHDSCIWHWIKMRRK
jgi:2-phosphosulfolactate phosphatase